MKHLFKHERRIGREFKESPVLPVPSDWVWEEDEFDVYEREWEWECYRYYSDADWYYQYPVYFLNGDAERAKRAWLNGTARAA